MQIKMTLQKIRQYVCYWFQGSKYEYLVPYTGEGVLIFIVFHYKSMGKFWNVYYSVDTQQSMEWIELKRSSPVQIHEALILIQSNPADDPEAESSPVQSGHNRVGIYQIPYKIYM